MIYIQNELGLTQISPQLTKEKVIAALGYTPADGTTFFEDESGALLIADAQGYVIARIDAEGMTTTKVSANAIMLDGQDLAQKLQEIEDRTPEIDLSNYYTKTEVDAVIDNIDIPETDLSDYYTKTEINNHTMDDKIHTTFEDKLIWNAKSDFDGRYTSLTNAPHIVNDNEDEVIICDSQGNTILRANAQGLNVSAIFVNGQAIPTLPVITMDDEGKILKVVNGVPTWVNP